MSFNTSIHVLPIAWNAKRFKESKSARNAARRSVFRAATTLLNSDLKMLESQNNEINHEIDRCRRDLHKYDNKLQILDNMTQLATQSLEVYFQARMENLRTFVTEQCRIISDGIQEEADHWKEIHAMLQQKLVVPGDLRSYGGGNGLPRPVKQSPSCSRIAEEEEPEEEENPTDVSTLLQSRSLTPLLTQTLKKARLLSSKLSRHSFTAVPPEMNMSKTVIEETIIEEPPTAISPHTSDDHVTLRDVSAIEKAIEPEHEIPNPDLSTSLLPCIPTIAVEEDKPNNKSVASTISDKTFVKSSLGQFSSDEDSDDDDDDDEEDEDDETIIEDSFSTNVVENKRPLLLTADRSIRRLVTPSRTEKHSLSHIMSIEQPKIKLEKVSIREALSVENNQTITVDTTKRQSKVSFREPLPVNNSQANKTLTSEENNEQLSHVPSTTNVNSNTSKLSPIKSNNENDEEDDVVAPLIKEIVPEEPPQIEQKPKKSPVLENLAKRRTTRRTTIRVLRENQNDNMPPPPPVEMPTKTRYQTRYSTRLATTVTHEDVSSTRRSTVHRRTTRFTSE